MDPERAAAPSNGSRVANQTYNVINSFVAADRRIAWKNQCPQGNFYVLAQEDYGNEADTVRRALKAWRLPPVPLCCGAWCPH